MTATAIPVSRPAEAVSSPLDKAAAGLLAMLVFLEFFLAPRWRVWNVHIRLVDVAVLTAGFFLPLRLVLENRWNSFFRGHWGLLTAFGAALAACLVCSAFSIDPAISLKEFVQTTEWFTLALFASDTLSRTGGDRAVRRLLLLVLTLTAVQALVGYGQYIAGISEIKMEGGIRITGTLGNRLASYLLTGYLIGSSLLTKASPRFSWRISSVVALLFGALLLVQVRTLWIFLPFPLLPLLAARDWRAVGKWTAALLMGFLICAAVLWVADVRKGEAVPGYTETLAKRGLSTVTMRIEMWSSACRLFKEHPWTGIGPGNYSALFRQPPYASERLVSLAETLRLGAEVDAHSGFFTRLSEMGILGTLVFTGLFLYLLFLVLKRCLSRGWDPLSLAVGSVVVLSIAADLIGDWLGGNLFWVFVGTLWMLPRFRSEMRPEARPR